jgi:hypothetical protein
MNVFRDVCVCVCGCVCVDVCVCVCVHLSDDRACDEFTCARIYFYVLLPPRASASCMWFSQCYDKL